MVALLESDAWLDVPEYWRVRVKNVLQKISQNGPMGSVEKVQPTASRSSHCDP